MFSVWLNMMAQWFQYVMLLLIKLISDWDRHEFISLSNHCHCGFNKPPWSDFTVT